MMLCKTCLVTDGFEKPIKDLTDQHTAGTVFHMAKELARQATQAANEDADEKLWQFMQERQFDEMEVPEHQPPLGWLERRRRYLARKRAHA